MIEIKHLEESPLAESPDTCVVVEGSDRMGQDYQVFS
jgi:serine/threonine protein kinase